MKAFYHKDDGEIAIYISDTKLIEQIIDDLEDIIKSAAYNRDYERAKVHIDFFLELRECVKEMKGEKNNEHQ